MKKTRSKKSRDTVPLSPGMGVGTKYAYGCRTGPPAYVAWLLNSKLGRGIDSSPRIGTYVFDCGSIPTSSDTVESEGRADEAVLNKKMKK